jgi:hypothetical protein
MQQQQWQQTRHEHLKSAAAERAKAFFASAPAASSATLSLNDDEQSMCVCAARLFLTLPKRAQVCDALPLQMQGDQSSMRLDRQPGSAHHQHRRT